MARKQAIDLGHFFVKGVEDCRQARIRG